VGPCRPSWGAHAAVGSAGGSPPRAGAHRPASFGRHPDGTRRPLSSPCVRSPGSTGGCRRWRYAVTQAQQRRAGGRRTQRVSGAIRGRWTRRTWRGSRGADNIVRSTRRITRPFPRLPPLLRAGTSGSRRRWPRPLHFLILQRLTCRSAPRRTMPAPPRAVRATIVGGAHTEVDVALWSQCFPQCGCGTTCRPSARHASGGTRGLPAWPCPDPWGAEGAAQHRRSWCR